MSEPLHWVMASSEARVLDDGAGRELVFVVYTAIDPSDGQSGWRWSATHYPSSGRECTVALGRGYPDPISARASAEYWLSVTREQNALRAALEAEGQS